MLPPEALRSACSGHKVWDAMQAYLIATGELHNNARMGWGKAVIGWSASPEEGLATLLDLNHRFALDGHAPPSYGGVLGCFGLFEGPKAESHVYGKVASKPLKGKYAQLAPDLLSKAHAGKRPGPTTGVRQISDFLVPA